MKKKRVSKTLLAVALLATMCFGTMSTALADPAQGTPGTPDAPATAAVGKILEVAQGTNVPAVTFTYKFDKISIDGSTAAADVGTMPAISDKTITYTTADTATPDANGLVKIGRETGNIFNGLTWPHAGVYTYRVWEQQSSNITNSATENITYSNKQYQISVYVANGKKTDGTEVLYVKNIGTVIETTTTPGTPGTPGTDKLDPTLGTTGSTVITNISDLSELNFTNVYVKTPGGTDPETPANQQLSISKTVAGDLGDRSKYFDFDVTLTKPATVTAAIVYKGYIVDASNTVVTDNVNVDNAALIKTDAAGKKYIEFSVPANDAATPAVPASISIPVNLKHDQKLVFPGAQVGAKFTANEAAVTDYTTTLKVFSNNVQITSGVTVPNTGAQLVGETIKNGAEYTNTYKDVTPTGIIMNNLPFFMLILVALGGLAAYVIAGSKRKSNYSSK